MKSLVKPPRLRLGDRVGMIAPASAPSEPAVIDLCAETVRRLGFEPVLAAHVRKRFGFLAGSDQQRADDIMSMFADRNIRAILCVRGGYGTSRLANLLDYSFIRKNPKILVGYSDITFLHCALLTKAGLVTFHGPMLGPDLNSAKASDLTVRSLMRAVTCPDPAGKISCRSVRTGQTVSGGKASGRLLGGNLTLLCSTLGTPFQPSFRGKILFFEEIDEAPYRLDRLVTQLLHAGALGEVQAVAVGATTGCVDSKPNRRHEFRQSLLDVLRDRLLPLGVPVLTGLPFGHTRENATLPLGVRATLDADQRFLRVDEPAVR